jgi:uncharacterized membrane protein YtjA (UPF0391 family)
MHSTQSARTRGSATLDRTEVGEEIAMLYYALVFLVVGLIAGALGLFGIAAVAGQIAWILFLVALVFLVIHVVSGRRIPIR